MMQPNPPCSEEELIQRCQALAALTIGQLAAQCDFHLPEHPSHTKGFLGSLLEKALGTTAHNQALPDFVSLGVELKTLPIDKHQRPAESTFVTSIPLLTIREESWETSTCYLKLRRVLWVPLESGRDIPMKHRRIGQAFLWSPTPEDLDILKRDWSMLTEMITLGQLEYLSARIGEYLQVRPKAAHGGVLCEAYGAQGEKIKTLPRGFYLRRSFTTKIWHAHKM